MCSTTAPAWARAWARAPSVVAVPAAGAAVRVTVGGIPARDPGAKVVATSGGDAVAFKNPDGSLVAVMHSTSANSSYVVSIGGKKLQFSMPVGWATVKYKP